MPLKIVNQDFPVNRLLTGRVETGIRVAMNLRLFIAFMLLACGTLAAAPDAVRVLATAPLRFEPATDASADRFLARGARFQFEFSSHHAQFRAGDKAVRLEFPGAAPGARLEGLDQLRSKTALYLGNDRSKWRSGIPNYGRLQVRGLYSGVDLIYYGNAGELEYDLHVKPGADARRIRLRLRGERAQLDRDGNLVADLIQKRPVAYQLDPNGARVAVASRYRRNRDGSYGFALGPYDRSRELVIDPVLTLATYLGGSSQDIAYGIGHDSLGFVYVAGTTDSTDFPASGNPFQGALKGGADLFVVKIDPHVSPDLQIVFATYYGGSLGEIFGGMSVGPNGDVFLTGTTMSTDFPTVNAFQTSLGNGTGTGADAFVTWIDTNQQIDYSTYLGGSNADAGYAITQDPSGKVWVTGGTQSDDFPNLGGIQTGRSGSQDMFLAGFDASQANAGTLVYSSFLGGAFWETGRGLAAAPDGTFWVVGGTYSFDLPMIGSSFQRSFAGGGDAFVAHINPALGSDGVLYTTYLGGSGLEEARSVLLDPAGRVIVSGYTTSPDFPVTSDALQPGYGGNTDVFVSILNPANPPGSQLVYSTYFGGAGGDAAFDLKRDSNGVLYLAGFTLSPGLAASAGALQAAYDGTMDAFVLKLDPSHAGAAGLNYFSYLGSAGVQVAYGVDFDAVGNIYLAGATSSQIFDALGGPGKPSDPGNTDAFILGFGTCSVDASPHSEHFAQPGGTATIAIIAQQANCSWAASSGLDWVTVNPASGRGSGAVVITAAENDTGSPRQGTINIAGVQFAVSQD